MNEQAIKDAYNLFVQTGYTQSYESFKALINSNPQALQDAYGLFVNTGYNQNIESFKTLMGVGAMQPQQEDLKKKEPTTDASKTPSTPSVPSGFKDELLDIEIKNSNGSLRTEKTSREDYINSLTQKSIEAQLRGDTDDLDIINQEIAKQKDQLERPEFFDKAVNMITPEFIDQIEEVVVPQMNYQFGPMDFEFEESGMTGDFMIATAPNGQKKEFSLDPSFGIGAESTANELRDWIKANTNMSGLAELESQYTAGNKKYASEKEYRDTTIALNKEFSDFKLAADTYFYENSKVQEELNGFMAKTVEQKNSPEGIQEYQAILAKQKEINAKKESLQKTQESLLVKGKDYDSTVGKYVMMQAEQGQDWGAILNSFLQGASQIGATMVVNIGTDIGAELLTYKPAQMDIEVLQAARALDIEAPLDIISVREWGGEYFVKKEDYKTWDDWYASLNEQQKKDIEDKVRDNLKKKKKYGEYGEMGLLEAARTGYKFYLGSATTEAYKEKRSEESFPMMAVFGVAESLPAMIGGRGPFGWIQRGAQMYSMATDNLYQEMERNPEFKDVSEDEKILVAAPIAVAEATLEAIGLRNVIANKGLMNKIILRAMGKAGATTTAKTFGELVKNEVESMGGRALLTAAGAALAEAETGAAQQISEYAIKDVYNLIKEKEMFQTPDFLSSEYFASIGKSAAAEAIGGLILGIPSTVSAAYSQKGYKGMSDVMFQGFEAFSKDSNLQSAFIVDLKNKVSRGEMSIQDAKDALNNYRNSVGLFRALPEGLTLEGKKEAMNLLKEKRDLEQQIQGKDEALVKKQKARIEAINGELDALTNQPATETTTPSTGPTGNKIQILTEEEEKRKTSLEEAIARATETAPEGISPLAVSIGEELIAFEDAQTELDALNEKVNTAIAEQQRQRQAEGPSVLATPDATTSALESLPTNERMTVTFTQEDGTESPVMGNERMLSDLYHQVQETPEEDRTDWQQSVVDAVTVSLKTQIDEEVFQQEALQAGETIQPSQQVEAPVATVNGKQSELNDNFFNRLDSDKRYSFFADAIDKVPQRFRGLAKKIEVNTRKKILGLPIGKKGQTTYYSYNISGSEAKEYRNEIVSSQAKRAMRVSDIMANTARSLASAFPNLVSTSFKSLEEMKAYVEAKYGDSQISTQLIGGIGGMIIADENDNPIEILINQEVSTATTLPHEAWHAILVRAFGQNEELFKEFRDSIIKTLTDLGYNDIVNSLNEFSSTPEYQASNQQAQEWLVEFGGMLTASGITTENLDKKSRKLLEQIKAIFNRISEELFGESLFLEDATAEDVLDFMVSISERMAKGQDISQFFRDVDANESGAPSRVSFQVTAYHGSPKSFDKFTTKKMGTGEGAQAFGWGLYFSDIKDIAASYAKKLGNTYFIVDGNEVGLYTNVRDKGQFYFGTLASIYENGYDEVVRRLSLPGEYYSEAAEKEMLTYIDELKGKEITKKNTGQLYEVSLHEGKTPDQYTWLEWNKPVSEQKLNLIINMVQDLQGQDFVKRGMLSYRLNNLRDKNASDIYKELSNILGSDKSASLLLLDAGIDGIKYPAESISRGATDNTARGFNYVVFDENAVTIKNKLSFQKGGGVLQETTPKTSSLKDIDVKRVRTLSRPGSRVSKGLAIYERNKQKIVEEAPELSLAYVKENAPEVFVNNANLIAQYPIIRGIKAFKEIKTIEQAQEVYDIFSRQIADNLEYLMDNFRQDLREIATLWYDGANILAQNFSKDYGITTEQAAGIIASLSPQKDWYQNVRLAEMVMMAFKDNPVMSQEMVDYQRDIVNVGLKGKQKKVNNARAAYKKSRSKANANKLKKLIAKYDNAVKKSNIVLENLAGLIGTKMNDAPDYAKPYYARTYNEVNTTKDYNILSPDGKVIGIAKKKDGSNSQVAWGSYTEIGKAVAIYLDGSQANITRTLGEMHKIRNFYNNIIDPMSPDKDVTMDTHAVAAALMLPLSGASKQVEANFGTGTSNSAPLGIKGLYYAFAEGYNLAAEETGLLPRQVQSITWEAVRGLFTDDFKRDKKKVADINQIVDNYVNKKITLDEARSQITEYAGGIKDPSWAGGPLQEGTADNVEGEAIGRRSRGAKPDTVGAKRGGPRVKVSKQSGGGVLQEVQKIAQRYNMNNSGFAPAQVSEFAMNKELKPFGYSAKRAKPDANGRQGGVYILGPNGRFYNPFKAKFQRINLGAGNLGVNNVENIPGYARMLEVANGIIRKSLARGLDKAKVMDNVMKYVMGSKVYEIANDTQREQLVRNVETEFGKRQKSAPSVARLFGTIKDITKITMSEKELLKKQIKDLARGAKTAKIAWMKTSAQLAKDVKDLMLKGQLTNRQVASVIRRFASVNMFNEDSIDKFIDYMTNVFQDSNYDKKINDARKKLKTARANIRTKIGVSEAAAPILNRLFSINPTLIPDAVFDKYLALVDMFGAKGAVLTLTEVNDVVSDVNDILNAVDVEVSLAEELAMRFEEYDNKVFDEDGKLDYAKTITQMLEEDAITEQELELMKKYKSIILPKVQKPEMTEQEIQDEKNRIINGIKSLTVNPDELPTRMERDLANRFKNLLNPRLLNRMSISQLNNVAKLIDNINNGYLPHYAQLTVERLNAIERADTLATAIENAKPLSFTKRYAAFKSIFTRKNATLEMIRRSPLFFIDQVFGDFKTKDIFNAVFEQVAEGHAAFESAMGRVNKKLDAAHDAVAKSFNYKVNQTLESSFKMMAYLIQLEYDTNPESNQVNSAADYIRATVKHVRKGKSKYKERDAEMLENILDKYGVVVGQDKNGKDIIEIDKNKLFNSFNNAEVNAINTIREINDGMRDMAVYTAAVIRGERIEPLNNYIHLPVMHDYNPDERATGTQSADEYNNSLRPSTKAQSLIARTGKVSPINFDAFASAQRGAKFVNLDYYMTEPIRTARKTLNEAETLLEEQGRMPKKQREFFNAISQAFEEVTQNVLTNNFITDSFVDEVVNFISKQGYRAILASSTRFVAELASNIGFVTVTDPKAFAEGVKYRSIIMSPLSVNVMDNTGSKQTNRLFSGDTLSGRFIDTSIMSQASGVRSTTSTGAVANVSNMIYNLSLKKYKNFVEVVADGLISTPDKVVMRPIWFGSFATEFKNQTGREVDFNKIAANDEAYMSQNKEAIEKARDKADERSVLTGATDNPFMGILKGTTKPNQSALTRAFNNFNNFMTRFAIYEYTTARQGIYAAMGNGTITRKQGVAMLAGVTIRMTSYTLLSNLLANGLVGLVSDEEEPEDEKSFMQKFGQALTSTGVGLMLGRDFGNATKSLINYGVEEMNEEFLTELREGDYDPYEDAISYSIIPKEKKGNKTNLTDFITQMGGSFGPALKTADLIVRKAFEAPKKEEDAIERQEAEIQIRIPLEVLGNLGYVPLYKDVRRVVMNELYKELENAPKESAKKKAKEKAKLHGYENKTDLKRYAPDLYEQEFGAKSPEYEAEQYNKKIEKEKEILEQKMKDELYDYVPKQEVKKGFGSDKFGSGTKDKKKGFGSGSSFGSKGFGK